MVKGDTSGGGNRSYRDVSKASVKLRGLTIGLGPARVWLVLRHILSLCPWGATRADFGQLCEDLARRGGRTWLLRGQLTQRQRPKRRVSARGVTGMPVRLWRERNGKGQRPAAAAGSPPRQRDSHASATGRRDSWTEGQEGELEERESSSVGWRGFISGAGGGLLRAALPQRLATRVPRKPVRLFHVKRWNEL